MEKLTLQKKALLILTALSISLSLVYTFMSNDPVRTLEDQIITELPVESSTTVLSVVSTTTAFPVEPSTTVFPVEPSTAVLPVKPNTTVLPDPIRIFNVSSNNTNYIVYNSKCRIPNLDPFNSDAKEYYKKEEFVPCSELDLLTYVTKNNDSTKATLHIIKKLVPSYSNDGVICCISNVTRGGEGGSIDNTISLSSCEDFINSTALSEVSVVVRCRNAKNNMNVYNNSHAPVIITKNVQEKIVNYDRSQHPLSVLLVGLDSISRLNSMRVMPLTRGFLEKNDWLEMNGYNKMGDNTFPNVMAMLTGRNLSNALDVCNPKVNNKLDTCNFVWQDFNKLGYVTGYGEDHYNMATFNYAKKGFVEEPTDYYFRPYVKASEDIRKTYVDDVLYCAGPLSCTERILEIAEDFTVTFKDVPNFGLFWMNYAHNRLNAGTRSDFLIKNFLEKLKNNGVLENSIVLLLSDHGLRHSTEFLYTYTGWLEERLPMFFIWVPKWFRETFPLEYDNIRLNANKLTTPYDVYMTLQDILVYAGTNYTINKSEACPTCKSLFSDIPVERSCEEASIDFHWCTCTGYEYINFNESVVQDGTNFTIYSIHEIISSFNQTEKCAKYSFNNIISSRISIPSENGYKNDSYLQLIFETIPKAMFEATVKLELTLPQRFSIQGGISRLDHYGNKGDCVEDSNLRMYCTCQ